MLVIVLYDLQARVSSWHKQEPAGKHMVSLQAWEGWLSIVVNCILIKAYQQLVHIWGTWCCAAQ